MNFQIWMAPEDEYGVYTTELTEREAEAMKGGGFRLAHEFEACSRENAEAYFIGWCDNMSGVPNKVERIDFHKAGLK